MASLCLGVLLLLVCLGTASRDFEPLLVFHPKQNLSSSFVTLQELVQTLLCTAASLDRTAVLPQLPCSTAWVARTRALFPTVFEASPDSSMCTHQPPGPTSVHFINPWALPQHLEAPGPDNTLSLRGMHARLSAGPLRTSARAGRVLQQADYGEGHGHGSGHGHAGGRKLGRRRRRRHRNGAGGHHDAAGHGLGVQGAGGEGHSMRLGEGGVRRRRRRRADTMRVANDDLYRRRRALQWYQEGLTKHDHQVLYLMVDKNTRLTCDDVQLARPTSGTNTD